MHVFSDLFALFVAIAVTYIAANAWRYTRSRPRMSASQLKAKTQALEQAVCAINESKDISSKLSQIEVAIELAKDINRALPAGTDIQEQTAQLKELRTALANDALRLKTNGQWEKLGTETDEKQRVQLGQQILASLAQEKNKERADPRLIVHYEITVRRYLEKLEQTGISGGIFEDPDCPEYNSEMITAHDSLVDFSLENDLPKGVRFYQRTGAAELSVCGLAAFDLSFEIHGCRVNPEDLTHALGRSILRTIQGSISRRAHSIRCPEHGSAPKIVVVGHSLGDLSWKTRGCCTKLRRIVKQRLNNCH